MAEAYLKNLGGDRYTVQSAGLEPGNLNPLAVAVMKEEGIDISGNETNSATEFARSGNSYDYVITVCDEGAAASCPVFPGHHVKLHWNLPDPSVVTGTAAEQMEEVRDIRNKIKLAVENFIIQTTPHDQKISR